MTTATRPTPSVSARRPVAANSHDGLAFLSLAAAHLAALERGGIPQSEPKRHRCAHCTLPGTTASGALWRVSLAPDRTELYFLHTACLAPYKAAQGFRSVEGRLPLADTRPRLARRPAPRAPTARLATRSAAL